MMRDLHIHSTFSDGKNTPEEIVREAVRRGMDTIGFSDHSYTWFDESYCMKKDRIPDYSRTIRALSEEYGDRIRILLGIEQDYYSEEPTDRYDYVIASVHYLKFGEEFVEVDWNPEIQKGIADRYFRGDIYGLIGKYFETVGSIPQRMKADIVGHFDLFEINTGAIARGYRTVPYPSETLRDYIREKGGRFVLSSDSHQIKTLCYAFRDYLDEIKE